MVWVWLGAGSGWVLFGLHAQSQRRSAAAPHAGNTVPPIKGEQNGATSAGLSGCSISCGVIN